MNIVLLIKDFAVGKKFDKSGMPNQSGGEKHGLNHAKELIRLGHHVTIMAKKNIGLLKFVNHTMVVSILLDCMG